jgi:hypothetical protein
MGLKRIGCEGVKWVEMSQDMVKCRAFVKAVMSLRILTAFEVLFRVLEGIEFLPCIIYGDMYVSFHLSTP